MSPEQLRGNADSRSDIWALGTILYELLTGQAPFQAKTMAHLCLRVGGEEAPRASQVRPAVPPGLDDAIGRALAKKADDRFQTAIELSRALAPFGSASAPTPAPRDWVRRFVVAVMAAIVSIMGLQRRKMNPASGRADLG
jgi:serine/threonine-protein kinase